MTEQINFGTAVDPAADAAKAAHIAAMVAKSDATAAAAAAAAAPTTGTPAPTDLIGGKFKTQDDLLSAYKALEAKLGVAKPPEAPVTPPVVDPAKDPLVVPPAAATAVADAGFKMEDLATEFTANGDLKPETYEKLSKAGISKDMVAAFAAGQQAIANQTRTAVFAAVGIKDDAGYASVVQWASANLSAEEIAAYNAAVGSGTNRAQLQLAVEGLHSRFVRSQGSDPTLITGDRGANPNASSYASQAQYLAEVKDPRYAKDPAFRNAVIGKLSRSNF